MEGEIDDEDARPERVWGSESGYLNGKEDSARRSFAKDKRCGLSSRGKAQPICTADVEFVKRVESEVKSEDDARA